MSFRLGVVIVDIPFFTRLCDEREQQGLNCAHQNLNQIKIKIDI